CRVSRPTRSTLFPYTTLFRSCTLQFRGRGPVRAAADIVHGRAGREIARAKAVRRKAAHHARAAEEIVHHRHLLAAPAGDIAALRDRKSTRLNSSHSQNSYAVF